MEDDISITVDARHCLDFFRRARVGEAKIDALIARRETHQVVYEELAESRENVIDDALDYLDARRKPVTASTYKVRRQPIEEVVANHDEVAAVLSREGYGDFFAN